MTSYQKYKLLIIAGIGAILLLILYAHSSNGRYILGEESLMILDTRTGTLYVPNEKKYLELDEYTEFEPN